MSMWSLRWHFTNKSVTGAPYSIKGYSYSLSHSRTQWRRVRWLKHAVPSWGRGGTAAMMAQKGRMQRCMRAMRPEIPHHRWTNRQQQHAGDETVSTTTADRSDSERLRFAVTRSLASHAPLICIPFSPLGASATSRLIRCCISTSSGALRHESKPPRHHYKAINKLLLLLLITL